MFVVSMSRSQAQVEIPARDVVNCFGCRYFGITTCRFYPERGTFCLQHGSACCPLRGQKGIAVMCNRLAASAVSTRIDRLSFALCHFVMPTEWTMVNAKDIHNKCNAAAMIEAVYKQVAQLLCRAT